MRERENANLVFDLFEGQGDLRSLDEGAQGKGVQSERRHGGK